MGGIEGSTCNCDSGMTSLKNPLDGQSIGQYERSLVYALFEDGPPEQQATSDNEQLFWAEVEFSMFERCLSTLREASDNDWEPRPFPRFDVAIAVPKEQQEHPTSSVFTPQVLQRVQIPAIGCAVCAFYLDLRLGCGGKQLLIELASFRIHW